MSKWLEKKSIQELKDFISNATKKNSFFKTFKIDVSKKKHKIGKKDIGEERTY